VGKLNSGGGAGSGGTGWPGASTLNASGDAGSFCTVRMAASRAATSAVTGKYPALGVKSCPSIASERSPTSANGRGKSRA
jgi:hypothetical protein